MVISSSHRYSKGNLDVVNINTANKINGKRYTQNGQIQIYQSSYRGSYPSIIRDSLRNAALGRKVLLIQFMKGGVKQGVDNAERLCGNLTWVRSSHSFDQYNSAEIENNKNLIFLNFYYFQFPQNYLDQRNVMILPRLNYRKALLHF